MLDGVQQKGNRYSSIYGKVLVNSVPEVFAVITEHIAGTAVLPRHDEQ